jgi:hypothetical protein
MSASRIARWVGLRPGWVEDRDRGHLTVPHLKVLAMARLEILPSPLRDKVGYFHHDRFRG